MFDIKLQLNLFEIKKIFPKIKIILGNNAVESRGVKSNYFGEDLILISSRYLHIYKHCY
jgi:hypothetical protein